MKEKPASKGERISGHQLSVRLRGLRARITHMLRSGQQIDDVALEEKVYEKCSATGVDLSTIEITAHGGCVMLSGTIAAEDKNQLLAKVSSVPGVSRIEDRLKIGEVASLERSAWMPVGHAMAAVGGVMRRHPTSTALAVMGLGLLARSAATNGATETDNILSLTENRVECGVVINAPPEHVFALWCEVKHFAQFLPYIKAVRDLGDGRTHWYAEDCSGNLLEWNATIHRYKRPLVLSWTSNVEAHVKHSGRLCFQRQGSGTQVLLTLCCTASLIDSMESLEQGLAKMKQLIEAQAATPAYCDYRDKIMH